MHDLKITATLKHGKLHGKLVVYNDEDDLVNNTKYFKDGEEVKESEMPSL